MRRNNEQQIHLCQEHKNKQIKYICYSPQCNYYRQLCQKCSQQDITHKDKHINMHIITNHVKSRIKQFQQSLLIVKRSKQQKSNNNQITLPDQIQDKLTQIRLIINNKINQFQISLKNRYQKQVNMKLFNLDQTIKKSLDFLRKQVKNIDNQKYNLFQFKKFFINFDNWEHQKRYYESYIQQILEKQVRNFKESFDNDNIMKLIVNFQFYLEKVFIPKKQMPLIDSTNDKKIHLFFDDQLHFIKHQLAQKYQMSRIKTQKIPKNLPNSIKNYKYQWKNNPSSLYYPQNNCFYIFGQGNKPSDVIMRYEQGQKEGQGKFTSIANMIVKRADFAICLVFDQVFIIGGYNENSGCLNKCQKLVLFKNGKKIYLVSSLEQRSAGHSVCNYKNKFILKFGGTSVKKKYNNLKIQAKQLFPQIYSIQKEQWKTIKYVQNDHQRLKFGLWPVIIGPLQSDNTKLIIFGNQSLDFISDIKQPKKQQLKNQNERNKFEVKCNFYRSDIQIKIFQSKYQISKKYFLYHDTYVIEKNKNKAKIIVKDLLKPNNYNTLSIQKLVGIQ